MYVCVRCTPSLSPHHPHPSLRAPLTTPPVYHLPPRTPPRQAQIQAQVAAGLSDVATANSATTVLAALRSPPNRCTSAAVHNAGLHKLDRLLSNDGSDKSELDAVQAFVAELRSGTPEASPATVRLLGSLQHTIEAAQQAEEV